jgi:hypothetical protein
MCSAMSGTSRTTITVIGVNLIKEIGGRGLSFKSEVAIDETIGGVEVKPLFC